MLHSLISRKILFIFKKIYICFCFKVYRAVQALARFTSDNQPNNQVRKTENGLEDGEIVKNVDKMYNVSRTNYFFEKKNSFYFSKTCFDVALLVLFGFLAFRLPTFSLNCKIHKNSGWRTRVKKERASKVEKDHTKIPTEFDFFFLLHSLSRSAGFTCSSILKEEDDVGRVHKSTAENLKKKLRVSWTIWKSINSLSLAWYTPKISALLLVFTSPPFLLVHARKPRTIRRLYSLSVSPPAHPSTHPFVYQLVKQNRHFFFFPSMMICDPDQPAACLCVHVSCFTFTS